MAAITWHPSPCTVDKCREPHVKDEGKLWHVAPHCYYQVTQIREEKIQVIVRRYHKYFEDCFRLSKARIILSGQDYKRVYSKTEDEDSFYKTLGEVLFKILKGYRSLSTEVETLNDLPPLPTSVPNIFKKSMGLDEYQKLFRRGHQFYIPKKESLVLQLLSNKKVFAVG